MRLKCSYFNQRKASHDLIKSATSNLSDCIQRANEGVISVVQIIRAVTRGVGKFKIRSFPANPYFIFLISKNLFNSAPIFNILFIYSSLSPKTASINPYMALSHQSITFIRILPGLFYIMYQTEHEPLRSKLLLAS
jgi:hypothetical protein